MLLSIIESHLLKKWIGQSFKVILSLIHHQCHPPFHMCHAIWPHWEVTALRTQQLLPQLPFEKQTNTPHFFPCHCIGEDLGTCVILASNIWLSNFTPHKKKKSALGEKWREGRYAVTKASNVKELSCMRWHVPPLLLFNSPPMQTLRAKAVTNAQKSCQVLYETTHTHTAILISEIKYIAWFNLKSQLVLQTHYKASGETHLHCVIITTTWY